MSFMNDEPTPQTASSPAAPPGLSAGRAVAILAAFLGVQVLVMAPAAFWAGLHAGAGGRMDAGLAITVGLLGTAWAGIVAFWMAKRSLGGAMALIGWAPASPSACLVAALQGLGLVVSLAGSGSVLPLPRPGPGPLGSLDELSLWARVAGIVLVVVAAPVSEELLFRGVLYTGLSRRWGPPAAAILTTLGFVALHLPQLGRFWAGWILIGLAGALALRARVKTGSLLPAVALHATYNLSVVLAATMR
jgi:membrane protease YdiL (CAAX protease family)